MQKYFQQIPKDRVQRSRRARSRSASRCGCRVWRAEHLCSDQEAGDGAASPLRSRYAYSDKVPQVRVHRLVTGPGSTDLGVRHGVRECIRTGVIRPSSPQEKADAKKKAQRARRSKAESASAAAEFRRPGHHVDRDRAH